jgi:hypothetical protein
VIGKIIGKHKAGKHFIREITETSFVFGRDEENIVAYKNLEYVEQDFRRLMQNSA